MNISDISKMGWQVCLRNWEIGKFDWRRLFKVYVSSPSRCFDFQVRQSSSENYQPGISCSSWGNKENASNSSLSFWSCKAHCWIAFIEVTWCKLLTLEKDRLQRHPLQIPFFFFFLNRAFCLVGTKSKTLKKICLATTF